MLPQTLLTQSFAWAQAWLLAAAQVLVTALHPPLAQTAVARGTLHTPGWSAPSLGSGAPARASGTQLAVGRSQKVPCAQSASTQHEPGAEPTQVPDTLQLPD